MEFFNFGEWTDLKIAMTFSGVFILGFFILLIMVMLRARNQKLCRGNILCEFIPKAGKAFYKFIPDKGGVLVVPKKKKDDRGKEYGIENITTYPIDYPQGWPRMVQAEATKAVFWEDDAEPALNKGDRPVVSSRWLYNTFHEKFTELGVQFSQDIDEIKRMSQGGINIWLIYAIIAITLLGFGGIFYYLWENFEAIRAGLGV